MLTFQPTPLYIPTSNTFIPTYMYLLIYLLPMIPSHIILLILFVYPANIYALLLSIYTSLYLLLVYSTYVLLYTLGFLCVRTYIPPCVSILCLSYLNAYLNTVSSVYTLVTSRLTCLLTHLCVSTLPTPIYPLCTTFVSIPLPYH